MRVGALNAAGRPRASRAVAEIIDVFQLLDERRVVWALSWSRAYSRGPPATLAVSHP
jgi:hypothetical protein